MLPEAFDLALQLGRTTPPNTSATPRRAPTFSPQDLFDSKYQYLFDSKYLQYLFATPNICSTPNTSASDLFAPISTADIINYYYNY